MSRKKHPKPEIEAALKYAEQNGWRIAEGGSHAWGKIYCPDNNNVPDLSIAGLLLSGTCRIY